MLNPKFWYAYIGTGDPTLARNYFKITGKPGSLNGPEVCNIYAPAGGFLPTSPLSDNIITYIVNGISMEVAQPQLPAGTKFFVYMKPE